MQSRIHHEIREDIADLRQPAYGLAIGAWKQCCSIMLCIARKKLDTHVVDVPSRLKLGKMLVKLITNGRMYRNYCCSVWNCAALSENVGKDRAQSHENMYPTPRTVLI